MWSRANVEAPADFSVDDSVKVLNLARRHLSIPESLAVRAVMARDDQDDYAAQIRLAPGYCGDSTHSEGGAGKCVPYTTADGRRASTIILPWSTAQIVLSALTRTDDVDCWSDDESVRLGVVSHEIGHALDHHHRQWKAPGTLASHGGTIEQVAGYYGVLFTDELAACLNAAPALSDRQQGLLAENSINVMDTALQKLATNGEQCYWCAIIEWAKYAGSVPHPMRSVRLQEFAEQQHSALVEFSAEFATVVAEFEMSYPTWDYESCIADSQWLASEFRTVIHSLLQLGSQTS